VVLSLLRWGAWAEEVSKFNAWSSKAGVLEIDNWNVDGISPVISGIPRKFLHWIFPTVGQLRGYFKYDKCCLKNKEESKHNFLQ
jgi:hypothetical protein